MHEDERRTLSTDPLSRFGAGALSREQILELIREGVINADESLAQPASFDLTLSGEIYRLRAAFLPRKGERIRSLLNKYGATEHHLSMPLERGVVYLARCSEYVKLPKGMYGYANPKSTTGRNGIHVRLITDSMPRYDGVRDGYEGELWISIAPLAYPVLCSRNLALAQLRLFTKDTRLEEKDIAREIKDGLVYDRAGTKLRAADLPDSDNDGGVILTVDVESPVAGWVCIQRNTVLDMSKIGYHDPFDFFEPITARKGEIFAKRGGFYILSTAECIKVPVTMAGEMRPQDERAGEFRVHAAGFFDPGWGCGANGSGLGKTGTLEVWPYQDMVFQSGHPVCKFKYERMAAVPTVSYDAGSPNYGVQDGPKLAKQFKQP